MCVCVHEAPPALGIRVLTGRGKSGVVKLTGNYREAGNNYL